MRERERAAQIVATFAANHPHPTIVLTDFNVTDQTTAYAILTGPLRDAWREAGWGFGHTWGRTVIRGVRIPVWFVRIDYVFYSPHWRALSAHTGPWDGISDHRAVSATLVLNNAAPGV